MWRRAAGIACAALVSVGQSFAGDEIAVARQAYLSCLAKQTEPLLAANVTITDMEGFVAKVCREEREAFRAAAAGDAETQLQAAQRDIVEAFFSAKFGISQ